jgi:hypothetical protein
MVGGRVAAVADQDPDAAQLEHLLVTAAASEEVEHR